MPARNRTIRRTGTFRSNRSVRCVSEAGSAASRSRANGRHGCPGLYRARGRAGAIPSGETPAAAGDEELWSGFKSILGAVQYDSARREWSEEMKTGIATRKREVDREPSGSTLSPRLSSWTFPGETASVSTGDAPAITATELSRGWPAVFSNINRSRRRRKISQRNRAMEARSGVGSLRASPQNRRNEARS